MLKELDTLAPWRPVAGLVSLRELCPAAPLQTGWVDCPSHCSLEAQGNRVRWEMAHGTGEGPASPHHTELGLQERERRK